MNTNATNNSDLPIPDEVNRYAIFAALPPEQMLDAKGLAHCLKCSPRTVWRYVARFQLPPPIQISRQRIVITVSESSGR